jgi:hypothetical protein
MVVVVLRGWSIELFVVFGAEAFVVWTMTIALSVRAS